MGKFTFISVINLSVMNYWDIGWCSYYNECRYVWNTIWLKPPTRCDFRLRWPSAMILHAIPSAMVCHTRHDFCRRFCALNEQRSTNVDIFMTETTNTYMHIGTTVGDQSQGLNTVRKPRFRRRRSTTIGRSSVTHIHATIIPRFWSPMVIGDDTAALYSSSPSVGLEYPRVGSSTGCLKNNWMIIWKAASIKDCSQWLRSVHVATLCPRLTCNVITCILILIFTNTFRLPELSIPRRNVRFPGL